MEQLNYGPDPEDGAALLASRYLPQGPYRAAIVSIKLDAPEWHRTDEEGYCKCEVKDQMPFMIADLMIFNAVEPLKERPYKWL